MNPVTIESIASSRHRTRIAHLLSIRPRTLRELADATGISIQGVLKHLTNLRRTGLLEEIVVKGSKHLAVRKVYATKGASLGDYSRENSVIISLSEDRGEPVKPAKDVYAELEGLAEDALIQRRRIGDQARRLQRTIDNLVASESRLKREIETLGLDQEETLIAETAFTEDSLEDAALILSKYYGSRRAETALKAVMSKVRKLG